MKFNLTFQQFLDHPRDESILFYLRQIPKWVGPDEYEMAKQKEENWTLDRMQEKDIVYFILHKEQYKNAKRTKKQQKAIDEYNQDIKNYYEMRAKYRIEMQKYLYDELVVMGVIEIK
jgi:hypothetical protein